MEETTVVEEFDPVSWVSKLQVEFIDEEDGSGTINIEWDETDPDLDYWNSLGDEGRKKFVIESLKAAIIREIPDADVSGFLE